MAPDAATCSVGRAHCHLDLPQSTTTVAAATNRHLGQSAAVRITTVRATTVGIAAIAGAVGIAVFRIARTVGDRVGGQRADGIRDGLASHQPESALEALVP